MAGARVAVRAVHLIPEPLDRERVLTQKQRAQRPEQAGEHFPIDGTVETLETASGADADVVLRERGRLWLRVGGILIGGRPAIGVEMRRLNLVLTIHAAHHLARPREA